MKLKHLATAGTAAYIAPKIYNKTEENYGHMLNKIKRISDDPVGETKMSHDLKKFLEKKAAYQGPQQPGGHQPLPPNMPGYSGVNSGVGGGFMGQLLGNVKSTLIDPKSSQNMGMGIASSIGQSLQPFMQTPGMMFQEWARSKIPRAFGDRKDVGSYGAQQFMQGAGKELGTTAVQLLKDMVSKAVSAAGAVGDSATRKKIVEQLKAEDPILAQADDTQLMEAFHTMARFAPTLSTDKNAVKSYLRESVMTGAGPNYATIKMLAEAERAVAQAHMGG